MKVQTTFSNPHPSEQDQTAQGERKGFIIALHPDDQLNVDLEKQVTVKIRSSSLSTVRIWPTVYLQCIQSGIKSHLIYSEGIGQYPNWSMLYPGKPFILIFGPLPSTCLSFDLFEDIPEPGGFILTDIPRNRSAVYDLWIDCAS